MSYKDYRRVMHRMPDRPDVLKLVDAHDGIVYVNADAQPDANIIVFFPPCWWLIGRCGE